MKEYRTQEHELIKQARGENLSPCSNSDLPEEWARFGFFVGFRAFEMIRKWRLKIGELQSIEKEDGSPATYLEEKVEEFVVEKLAAFYPEANFWGEESGNLTSQEGEILLIMDPIDGTRSFLGGFDTYALSMSILKGEEVLFSLICTPPTGDFGYRIGNHPSRFFQFPFTSQEIEIFDLPYIPQESSSVLLVNIHAAKVAMNALDHLYKLWNDQKVALVRSLSGSPSQMILEVARGGGVYINSWSGRPTMPFDLITAYHILKGAGGHMIGLNGEEIDPRNHQGMYLVGFSQEQLAFLKRELNSI